MTPLLAVGFLLEDVELPFCDVCQKPVARLDRIHDVRLAEAHFIFVASCHGESEEVIVTLADVDKARGKFQMGQAFVKTHALGHLTAGRKP